MNYSKILMTGRHLRGAPFQIIYLHEEVPAGFFCFSALSNRNLYFSRLIDVEVDDHEKTPAVCDQEERGPSSSYFNPVLPGCSDRRMLCFFIRIWLHTPAMYGDYHS